MTSSSRLIRITLNGGVALLAGLALRLYFVFRFPMSSAADSTLYTELAQNWLDRGIYALRINGQLTPVDVRMPGYPAFLAAVYATFGRGPWAVLLVQAMVDLATCAVVALLAAKLAPAGAKRRAALAALWLAALCPFVANYATGILTEVLVTFLTACALLVLAGGLGAEEGASCIRSPWLIAGLIVGLGTLVRPETPLLLFAAGLVLLMRWRNRADWGKVVRNAALMLAGMLLPLAPWAVRNWRVLGEAQLLAPRYTQLPGEMVPKGFYAWTNTWLWRFRDVYLVPWKLEEEEIHIEDIPDSAFDSSDERTRVAAILEDYNNSITLTQDQDAAFGEIAAARTARHPLRSFVKIPFERAFSIWFTPRIELLPYSGDIWPLREAWEDDRQDFLVTLGFGALGIAYAAIGLAGAWMARRSPIAAFLVLFCLVRTIFFLHFDTPEPRYVLECFPAVIALGAQLFAGNQRSPAGSG